jgi:rhodanese-related sulfurtransferase
MYPVKGIARGHWIQRAMGNVVNLQGGVIAWVRAGQDLVIPLPKRWAAQGG